MYRSISDAFVELINIQGLTSQQRLLATTRIQTISQFMQNEFELRETPFVNGSYARGTMCSGERDIDIMVPFEPLGRNNYWQRYNTNSSNFLYWVRDALNDRYATTDVSSKQVAVTLDFNTIKVDLVPCFPRQGVGNGYWMPNGVGRWNSTNPKYHTQLIKNGNNSLAQRLKPLIKLAKTWNDANGHHLSSFHVEMMVEGMWRNVPSIPSWSDAMKKTISTLPSWINTPFKDPWDNSKYIDTYLSSATKQQVLRMLAEDTLGAERAEEYRINNDIDNSFEKWDIVFHRTFPSRIV